jgi:hypothetical protein
MGYYGYDLQEFKGYIRHVTSPTFTFALPPGVEAEFDNQLWKDLNHYMLNEAEHFIFIYGQNDTWSATGVYDLSVDVNSRVFVKEEGSHRTRINNMPEEQREEVYKTIRIYMKN